MSITLQTELSAPIDNGVIAIVDQPRQAFAFIDGSFVHTAEWHAGGWPDWNWAGEVEPHRAEDPALCARVERLLRAWDGELLYTGNGQPVIQVSR